MNTLYHEYTVDKSKRVEKVSSKSVLSLFYSNIIVDVFIRKS
jgi:hypothetical protein